MSALRLLSVLLLGSLAAAQRLPFTRYDVAEGLPASRVNALLQDQHGFLWVGTWEGLARFDGERFTSYDGSDGLANPLVTALALDPRGELWAGTYAGLAHLVEGPHAAGRAQPFELLSLGSGPRDNEIGAIGFEEDGSIWCGTSEALHHVVRGADGALVSQRVLPEGVPWSGCFVHDESGALWCATTRSLLRLARGAVVEHFTHLPPGGGVVAFVPRPDGATFVAEAEALYVAPRGSLRNTGAWARVDLPLRAGELVRCALLDAHGTLWLGTRQGLVTWKDGRARRYGPAEGLIDDIVLALCEDREHDLWIGTSAQGLHRLPTRAIESWTLESGLPAPDCPWLVEAQDGAMVVSTTRGLATIRGGRVELPPATGAPLVVGMGLHQDRHGDWWMIDGGRVRFARGPELDPARAVVLGPEHGLPEGTAFGAFLEDARGVLWTSILPATLARKTSAPGEEPRFEALRLDVAPGLEGAPRVSLELPNGDVWLAPYRGLWRRRGGRLDALEVHGDGRPVEPRWILRDHTGTVWIGTRFRGVWRTRDPESERPAFEPLSTLEPLPSQAVFALAEDRAGRLWIGTGRGLERLDADGHLRHFGTAEGLAGEIVHHLHVDRAGALWVATNGGVSRVDTEGLEEPTAAPEVRFVALRVAGVERPIDVRGARELDLGELEAAQDNLFVEFTAPCLRRARELAFEYRLGDEAPWVELGPRRTLSFAGLAPGPYSASIRARTTSGSPADAGALLRFAIRPPFWRTAWFALSALALAGFAGWTLHRARLRRLVALEAVRLQIASDVHDEMGAGLAQIAVLAEVARRDATDAVEPRLSEVARLARTLRESMSDIVWAVDPRKDSFQSLVERLRHVAHNLFAGEGARVEFAVPPEAVLERLTLAPDRRRQLFLVLKEALSNAARHARAHHVRVELALADGALRARIADDGRGFDPGADGAGHGLAGMRRRVESLGGRFELHAAPGAGTRIELALPLARP